jgi:anaerobic selenocysteine-containing dehydrogenase
LGVVAGDWVSVMSNRGHIVGMPAVAKRIKPLIIDGKKVQTVGFPSH